MTLERVRNSLLESFRSRRFSLLAGLDAKSHNLDRSFDPEPLGSGVRTDSIIMEDAVRALQQQVNALMSQNAALEAQLVGQQNMAQGLAELPGAITTVLSRSQAPMRRMLVDPKGSGKPPVSSSREEHFYVWTKKVEKIRVWCVPKCAWSFDVCSGIARRGHSSNSCNWRA